MGSALAFGERTLIMGVINVTPDSFYPASRAAGTEDAVRRGLQFAEAGADIVDVGGMSTRPGAAEISTEEELSRVLPVVSGLSRKGDLRISIDTSRALVAEEALREGADIVNDVSGLGFDPALGDVVRRRGAYIVLMHMRGRPDTMQSLAEYGDVVEEVSRELDRSVERALASGVPRDRIILDPGIGFAKTARHNLRLLRCLPALKSKGFPVLVGLSRKSFLGALTGLPPEERLLPTVAANAITIFQGADIIRVHDVREAVLTAKVADAIKKA